MFSEQVLHRVKTEQRPARGPDEAVCWSRCRKTREHTDAWVDCFIWSPDGSRGIIPPLVIVNWTCSKEFFIRPNPGQILRVIVLLSHIEESWGFLHLQYSWLLANRNDFCHVLFIYFSCSALLIKAHSMPFQVQPSTMASVVKGLYSLQPGELCYYHPFSSQKALVCIICFNVI